MSHLFISIATSGLIKESLSEDSKQQPWICRIVAEFCTANGSVIDSFAANIRAEDRTINPEATKRHGITTAMASRSGVYEMFPLGMVCGLKAGARRSTDYPGFASCARFVIAWDAPFLKSVIGYQFARHGEASGAWIRPGLSFISLQELASPWLRLPDAEGGYRKATRDEAAEFFTQQPKRPLPHIVDENLTRERAIYFALLERNAFEVAA